VKGGVVVRAKAQVGADLVCPDLNLQLTVLGAIALETHVTLLRLLRLCKMIECAYLKISIVGCRHRLP
jgi:hypothetical protein